jgi:hypothetical protein
LRKVEKVLPHGAGRAVSTLLRALDLVIDTPEIGLPHRPASAM